jgi:sensor c-di-GMP phosphodiesterase-like protein
MELEVTAEGVDTAEALALLRVMGCDLLQGFLISPPLNVADLQDFICTKGQERARDLLPSVGKRFREQTGSLRASESRS